VESFEMLKGDEKSSTLLGRSMHLYNVSSAIIYSLTEKTLCHWLFAVDSQR